MKNKNIKILLFVLLFVINISFVSGWNNSNKWNSDNIKSYLKFTPFYDSIYINSENNIGLFWFNKLDSNFYYIDKNGSHSFNSGSSGGNTDTLNTNEINFNADKSTISQSNINYYYPATIDNFDSLNTTDWTLTSPAVIHDGAVVFSGIGSEIVSKYASGAESRGTWKWIFRYIKLTTSSNHCYISFETETGGKHSLIKIDGSRHLYISKWNGDDAWLHYYSDINDLCSIMIKKIKDDSVQVFVNDTFRVTVKFDFTNYKYPVAYSDYLTTNSTNDSIFIDSYSHSSEYSNATFSYNYNSNKFIAMLDSDTMFTATTGKMNSDTLSGKYIDANKADIDTLTADSIDARTVSVGDTIWVNGVKLYSDGLNYLKTDYFHVNGRISSDAEFMAMKYRVPNNYPFIIQLSGTYYDDSLLFILTGAGGDTVATIDSFNTVRVRNEVAEEKPGFFVYQDSNTVETTISTQSVWYAIDNWTVMDTDHVDIVGDTAFVVQVGGDYCIHCSMSALASASGDTYDMGLFVNDTLYSNALISERYFSSSNVGSWSFIGKANLQSGDTIALKIRDISGTKNLLFKYGQFLIEAQ